MSHFVSLQLAKDSSSSSLSPFAKRSSLTMSITLSKIDNKYLGSDRDLGEGDGGIPRSEYGRGGM